MTDTEPKTVYYHQRETLDEFLNNHRIAHMVSRNSLSNLAGFSQTCLWHYWFLKFAFLDAASGCGYLAAVMGWGRKGFRSSWVVAYQKKKLNGIV